jgi:hypothetical protein
MKPFDIELAKAGHRVCTREGNPVKIICFDRNSDKYPIIALVDRNNHEYCQEYTIHGSVCDIECEDDLCMATVKKEGWINLYCNDGKTYTYNAPVYSSEEEALKCRFRDTYIGTVKIECDELQ